jgi:UDP-glucose 4-epimerase
MKSVPKIVLVTGANGFIGSHLCDTLIKKDYKVIGLVFGDEKIIKHFKENKKIKLIRGDLTDFKGILKIFKKYKPKGVFHTAAVLPSSEEENNPFPFFEVNIKGTLNLLEACRLINTERFIYSSSMSIYGRKIKYLPIDEKHPISPFNFYGLSKWQGEELAKFYNRKYNINIIILRYAGVYGSRKEKGVVAKFIKNAIRNKPLRILTNTSWDIIYVKDVVKANIWAFEKANKLKFQIINIGSGKEINIKDLAKRIIEIVASKSKIKYNKVLPSFRFYFNIAKAKKLLGFKPLPPDRGLFQYIREIKKE